MSDPREAADILLRRARQFDRSPIVADWFRAANPAHHIGMASASKGFRRNRALLGGLMGPAFLGEAVAPAVYGTARELVTLWAVKAERARGRPWCARRDAYDFALDAIWGVLVPKEELEESGLVRNRRFLIEQHVLPEIQGLKDEAVFPNVEHAPIKRSFLKVADSLELVLKSAIPKLYGWWLRQLPAMKKEYEVRFEYFRKTIDTAVLRLNQEHKIRCVVDDVLRKEAMMAKKEERLPNFHADYVEAEVSSHLYTTRTPMLIVQALWFHNRRIPHHLKRHHVVSQTVVRPPNHPVVSSLSTSEGISRRL